MKSSQPPRLAVALLNRFVPDNEPLAGDLVEAFRAGRSRPWFWRQVLLAIAIGSFQKRREPSPLGLGAVDPTLGRDASIPARGIPQRLAAVNLSGSPVPGVGVGGLGLIALGVLVAVVRPDAWWVLACGVMGGLLLGIGMVAVRRRRVSSPSGDRPAGVLFERHDADR